MLPPFPSRDLAKLVLGYLAEEELMVVYDEFLQASPYLDALQNEYGWMFMTSLRSILAEYRAVKIYVETGMPFSLRKKISHCTNLLDIMKFLVKHININKIQSEEAAEKARYQKPNLSINPKASCENCTSLNLVSCACKFRDKPAVSESESSHLRTTLQSSVETTPLAVLPGNYVTTRKKQVKVLEKDSIFSYEGQSSDGSREDPSQATVEERKTSAQLKSDSSSISTNSTVQESDESRKKIEEFDDVFKSVVSKNSKVSGSSARASVCGAPGQRVASAGTFHDFAAGVASRESRNANIPDSSTSDHLSLTLTPLTKDYTETVKGPPLCNLLLQVSRKNESQSTQTSDRIEATSNDQNQKIKILSDVTVGQQSKVLKAVSSTPAPSQMQTILINGTPAYKPISTNAAHTYTKEDIMAMNLIFVPAPGASNIPTSQGILIAKKGPAVSKPSAPSKNLGPLVIDVPDVPPTPAVIKQTKKVKQPRPLPKPTELSKLSPKLPDTNVQNLAEADLIKSLDLRNASVPKDTVTGVSNTPHVLPPARRSSSTPRRTSHVRVLDFATPLPRRILHETNEQIPGQTTDAPTELILSDNPNADSATTSAEQANDDMPDNGSTKENAKSKADWDADLRANIGDPGPGPSKRKNSKKHTKKKKAGSTMDTLSEDACSCNHTKSAKSKKTKKSRKVVDLEDEEPPPLVNSTKPDVPVKPNINIISGGERVSSHGTPPVHVDKTEVKCKPEEKQEDCIDTPENERLSLQNVIGAKLNISDLLETPYKQALYDIQMGTPRFLAPDLPDEPLSDIKIMNIPTPRFLDSPKPAQATPSSYSSRPTDYSSGGSYYKPDDQDYRMPTPDLRCAVSSSKEDITVEENVNEEQIKSEKRPRRQCTKNVSYYQLANPYTKQRDIDNVDAASSCSDSTVSTEDKHKVQTAKPRERSSSTSKESKKRTAPKKKKTPVVKAKSFVRIKPRQSPTKATPIRYRKNAESPRRFSPGAHKRNRSTSKDKNMNTTTPPTIPASTKSRRKSSTPRKLHTSKSLNPDNAPEKITNAIQNAASDTVSAQHSDTEQLALRWSDDGSREAKVTTSTANDCEDIAKIRDYILITDTKKPVVEDKLKLGKPESEGSLRADLVKRGFDMDTAKKIERDLLDTPPPNSDLVTTNPPPLPAPVQARNDKQALDISHETDHNASKDLQIVEDDEEDEEVEFTVHNCDEESSNYILMQHDYDEESPVRPQTVLKDTYCMEVCVDEVTVRLRATPFSVTLDQSPKDEEIGYSYKETQMAVNSICNLDRLYTPLKETIKAQYINVFDSTLTSLDTPLKSNSPARRESVKDTEILSDDEQTDRQASKKRKRSSDSHEECDSKKTKYYLASASIQNIDIESVLTKLHGP